jgi:serine/threonine protein kinase
VSRTVTRDRFPPGTRIGDYVVERELRSASPYTVYVARHVVLPRQAELKVMHGEQGYLKEMAVHMLREACLVEALSHPGIPRVYECGVLPDRRPWTAFEHIEGEALDQSIGDVPLPVADVVVMMRDVADILDHIHQRGIAHRKVTASSIIRAPLRRFPVTLTQWSDACTLDTAEDEVDPNDDVHELGRIAFRALTGAVAATGGSSTERYPGAPGDVAALIDSMMAGRRARPTSAEVRERAKWLAEAMEQVPLEPRRWTPQAITPDQLPADVEQVDEGFSIRISGRTRTRG